MPRLMGVDIPNDKQIQYSLTYLYGVGFKTARDLCEKLGINPATPAHAITEDQIGLIASTLERDYTVEGPLRRQITQNISRLREIKSYRGMRHRQGLPVRGQRTKTNSRTRKGPRKTVAGKKGVKDMR
jgi:small subunit ribosomal protein S13